MPQRAFAIAVVQFWQPPHTERIGADQINSVRHATPIIVVGNVVNAGIVAVGLTGYVSAWILAAWTATTVGLSLSAALKWTRSREHTVFIPTLRRLRRIVTNVAAFALPWGCLAAVQLGNLPPHQELVVVTVTAGMAGGGAVFLAPVFPAALVYLVVVLGPVAAKGAALHALGYGPFAALALSYFAFLWAVVCWSARQHLARSEANAKIEEQKCILQTIVDHFPGGLSYRDKTGGVIVSNVKGQFLPYPVHADGPEVPNGGRQRIDLELPRTNEFVGEQTVDGTIYEVRETVVSGDAVLVVSLDVTDRHRSQQALAHLAKHDVLTNLPNRFSFLERLDKAITGSRRADKGFALLSVDLDRFKEVNDTLGHPVGDLLLVEVAARLSGCVRDGDIVARLGGDEFSILQAVVDPCRDAAALAERIKWVLGRPINLGDHTVCIDVSIGIAFAPGDARSGEDLSRKADLALLDAKAGGRNQFRFFEPTMDSKLSRRRAIETGLRQAIERHELHLVYQPILDLREQRIVCFEALLRWQSADLGSVMPSEFIPVAEETGSIAAIGRWVVGEACREAATWPDGIRVAVNLSPVQFKYAGLADTVAALLRDAQLSAERLEIEVTETAMLNDTAVVLQTLTRMRAMGVRIALDDFGTGHSSLANLKNFPFDKIKIDRTFVVDLKADDPSGATFVTMIAGLGRHLGLCTTAEGVETAEQRQLVSMAGCTEIQGYNLARPMHPAAVPGFLEDYVQVRPSAA